MLFPFPPFICNMHVPPQTLPVSPIHHLVRSELLPLLTFIHSTPQTGQLITTHTVSYLLRKSWARHALQGPTSPQNYSATTGIPVPSGQHSPAITTITFPKILPLSGTTNPFLMDYKHHIHTAPPVNPTIK